MSKLKNHYCNICGKEITGWGERDLENNIKAHYLQQHGQKSIPILEKKEEEIIVIQEPEIITPVKLIVKEKINKKKTSKQFKGEINDLDSAIFGNNL